MIPALVADEIRETLLDYLRTTWALADHRLEQELFRFLETGQGHPGSALFQGPYISVKLPFASAPADVEIPLDVKPPYQPHLHQLQAWQRLTSRDGHEPAATLVTTGTGSGKTECFLYPILDHCLRAHHLGQGGIKAIVLYPMNALASDQARRIAEIVHGDPRLLGRLRVGLYVGGDGHNREMGKDHVIDHHDVLQRQPPDILLTNYRMLDLLLVRPKDRGLWLYNKPGALRYLVLDELHTYDGAQGTDVACLIRRLGARLGSMENLCAVGTSATVTGEEGDGAGRHSELLKFASRVFDQTLDVESVIEERRLTAEQLGEVIGGASQREQYPMAGDELLPEPQEDAETHVRRVALHWFPRLVDVVAADAFRLALGQALLVHPLGKALIARASKGVVSRAQLELRLAEDLSGLRKLDANARRTLVTSMLTLLSWGQRQVGNKSMPLVHVQVQLWIREVRRLLREIGPKPSFFWRDERPQDEAPAALPMYHCRECGHSGWIGRYKHFGYDDIVDLDYARVAQAWQAASEDVVYLHLSAGATDEDDNAVTEVWFDRRSCRLEAKDDGSGQRVRVYRHQPLSNGTPRKDLRRCPACCADGALAFLASRSATLASVAVGHLYTTPLNTDRKLLAFNDSVQDASHRAGFFSGRTYRFTVRSAMLSVVPADGDVALSDVAPMMLDYWSTHRSPGETQDPRAAMVAALLPKDLEYLPAYEAYRQAFLDRHKRRREAEANGREFDEVVPEPSAQLLDQLSQRLRWEVVRELGLASRIGRTLEQSACISVAVDEGRYASALAEIQRDVPERIGCVQDVQAPAWRAFVGGLITRMRRRGAVFDPMLEGFILSDGHPFQLSRGKQPLLSPFGQHTGRPQFLCNGGSRRFDLIASGKRKTWYGDWATRALGVPLGPSDVSDLYAEILKVLVSWGILGQWPLGKHEVWGLLPEALRVSRRHVFRCCAHCGMEISAVENSPLDPLYHPCPRYRCEGTLEERGPVREARAQSYYRRFYERGILGRVWSEEHTGLLERQVREDLELEFKERPRPDAPNLLSCTPTLEMGIDIGDLSATLLCSVPPSTSSYLQRVGRAGRQTGNALILTFAGSNPHDRYFYEEPEQVMAGAIRPPGCYLDAPAVLERQALAWCFDHWAATGPKPLGRLQNILTESAGKTLFPGPLLDFIQDKRQSLQRGFLELFGGELRAETRASLEAFFEGPSAGSSPLEKRLVDALDEVNQRKNELRNRFKSAKERLAKLEQDEAALKALQDPVQELLDLRAEIGYLRAELFAILERDLFGWLCDRSLLPNYAFPEPGVTLNAFVRGEETDKDAKDGEGTPTQAFSWIRAPSTAIRELAPFNTFYGSGVRVLIDNVDLRASSVQKGSKSGSVVTWQFCERCHHMAPVPENDTKSDCPSCGDSGWQEAGRRRKLVRMSQVRAFARRRDAVFGDEAEQRQREYYETYNFYDVNDSKPKDAWCNETIGFGFELLPDVVLRRVNFGLKTLAAPLTQIGGRLVSDISFLVCEECGQVRSDPKKDRHGRRIPVHRGNCTAKHKPKHQPTPIHLYRELKSEAIRILLPFSTEEAKKREANVRAAIRLGVKTLYGGDPEFLGVDIYDEPHASNDKARRRYLIIQDMVPGGTGLLAELALSKGSKLKEALELSLGRLRQCGCNKRQPAVRACYQCLYAYREQEDLHLLDRDTACTLLETMLEGFSSLTKVESGLSGVSIDSLLESELERRLYSRLVNLATEDPDFQVAPLENEVLDVQVAGRHWRVTPQKYIDPAHTAAPCRPDLLIEPVGQGPEVRPVALFADGLEYHVRPSEVAGRIADDVDKRGELLKTGRYLVWSMSWWDVDAEDNTVLVPPWMPAGDIANTAEKLASKLKSPSAAFANTDPFRSFIAYLKNPLGWNKTVGCAAFAVLHGLGRQIQAGRAEELLTLVSSSQAPAKATAVMELLAGEPQPGGNHVAALVRFGAESEGMLLLLTQKSDLGALATRPESVRGVLRLSDRREQRQSEGFRAAWLTWMRAQVFLQFLPSIQLVSDELIDPPGVDLVGESVAPVVRPAARFTPFPRAHVKAPSMPMAADLHVDSKRLRSMSPVRAPFEKILENLDEAIHPSLRAAEARGFSEFAAPYELVGPDGVEGEIEVAWPAQQVGLYLEQQRDIARRLEREGWRLLAVEARPSPAQLLELLEAE
jgi:DEAD/DEAH box helicase domain-containing protein